MTSHLYSHRTTDIKPEMSSGVQTRNGTPHDKCNIRGIANARTKRKYNIFMQRRLVKNFTFILEWGQGTCSLMKHTLRCTFRFAAFFMNILFFMLYGGKVAGITIFVKHFLITGGVNLRVICE